MNQSIKRTQFRIGLLAPAHHSHHALLSLEKSFVIWLINWQSVGSGLAQAWLKLGSSLAQARRSLGLLVISKWLIL